MKKFIIGTLLLVVSMLLIGTSTAWECEDCQLCLYVPPDVTVECTDYRDCSKTGYAHATDRCDANPHITYEDEEICGDCPGVKTIRRTWTARDCCGNVESKCQIIHVVDTCPPVLTVPPEITVECSDIQDLNKCGTAAVWDKCDPNPSLTHRDEIDRTSCAGVYTIRRYWTATDCAGNTVTKCQIIHVVDTTAPVINVPADITVECPADLNKCGYPVVTDNCDPNPYVNHTDVKISNGNCNGYIIRRYWTAKDCAGNVASKCQTITVKDTCPPVVSTSDFCLWPPNHKLYCINSFCNNDVIRAYDTCSSQTYIKFKSCTSNQPANGIGDGNTNSDCFYDGATDRLCIRAERAGPLDDRVYTVKFEVSDSSNPACANCAQGTLYVTVPHDQSNPAFRNCRRADISG